MTPAGGVWTPAADRIDCRSVSRRAYGLAALLLLVAAVAAGCGSDADSPLSTSANTPEVKGKSYANSVCFIATSWQTASGKIDDYEAKTASSQDVVDAVSQAQAPTTDFLSNIRGLQEPDNSTGKQAYDSLQRTADQISQLSSGIQASIDSLDTGAKKAQAQIESLYGALKTSVSQLDALYPQSGVSDAVAAQSNCAPLQS